MTDGLDVSVADATDLQALAAVHLRSALSAYRGIFPADAPEPTLADAQAAWRPGFADGAVTYRAVLDGVLVGGVIATIHAREPGHGNLQKLYVDPSAWRRGVARALHRAAVAWLADHEVDPASLWVLTENRRARAMYERWGWQLDTGPGATLTHPGLPVTEVRYALPMGRIGGRSAQ